MTAPRLVAFDLDDTLAPSKSSLDPRMLETFAALLEVVPVAVISGGNFEQFETQLVTPLRHREGLTLDDLHLLPTCGTRYYRWAGDDWALQYAEDLTDDQKARALAVAEAQAKDAGWGASRPQVAPTPGTSNHLDRSLLTARWRSAGSPAPSSRR